MPEWSQAAPPAAVAALNSFSVVAVRQANPERTSALQREVQVGLMQSDAETGS